MPEFYLEIAVFNSLNKFYHYAPQPNTVYHIGTRVWVPFGKRPKVLGIITNIHQQSSEFQLKPIIEVIDSKPIFNAKLLETASWIINYYFAPAGEAFSLFLPPLLREGVLLESLDLDTVIYLNITAAAIDKLKISKPQKQLLTTLQSYPNGLKESFLLNLNFKKVTINLLLKAGYIFRETKDTLVPDSNFSSKISLNQEQQAAVNTIKENFASFKVFLLNGVTGSGKTEVYIKTIALLFETALLNQEHPQVLVLLPEIGLTPQVINRFKSVFNLPLIVLHSKCSNLERARGWYHIQSGKTAIVLGTRSAIFAPFTNLKLIIIDEEHDSSYRQHDNRVRYSARDIGVYRANQENIPIILGSATPASETLYNCKIGKYTELLLKERALGTHLPDIKLIDIKGQKLTAGLSSATIHKIKNTLAKGQKVLIFLNKRGFAPLLLCHDCGWIAPCKNCTAHPTVHQYLKRLICHHCNYTVKIPETCANCGSAEVNSHGVGTEQLEAFFQSEAKFFNLDSNNILRLDRDTTSKKGSLEKILKATHANTAQILIGTQMLAKGHNFPNLHLVIILEGDYAFYSSDFRAQEKMLQLTLQVAGRSGRETTKGEVCVQTHFPEHKIWSYIEKHAYSSFMQEILSLRSTTNLPPYTHMALLRAEANKLDKMLSFLNQAKSCGIAIISSKALQSRINFQGPIPAPLVRKNNVYRGQLMIIAKERMMLHKFLKTWENNLAELKKSEIKYLLEIDPVELF